MTNYRALEAAIWRAIRGGWNEQLLEDQWRIHDSHISGRFVLCVPRAEGGSLHLSGYDIIFSHDFAQALWGREPRVMPNGHWDNPWIFHLQQMVLAVDPTAYLAQNLPGNAERV